MGNQVQQVSKKITLPKSVVQIIDLIQWLINLIHKFRRKVQIPQLLSLLHLPQFPLQAPLIHELKLLLWK